MPPNDGEEIPDFLVTFSERHFILNPEKDTHTARKL
jgi:hypothetical protein